MAQATRPGAGSGGPVLPQRIFDFFMIVELQYQKIKGTPFSCFQADSQLSGFFRLGVVSYA
jgi:hypothetical protein